MISRLARISPDTLTGRLLRLPLKLIPNGLTLRVRSGVNRGAKWVTGSSDNGCWLGTYEEKMQAVMSRLVKPGMVAWDVGANVGFFTLALKRLVAETGTVVAFEPLPRNARVLMRHVALNGLRDVKFIQGALSDESGLLGFGCAKNHATAALSPEGTELVRAWRGDDLVAESPELRPNFLKIDVEGAEVRVLHGLAQTISQHRPVMVMEMHSLELWRECFAILQGSGYRVQSLGGRDIFSPAVFEPQVMAMPR